MNASVRRCETCQYSRGFTFKHNVTLLSICEMPLFRKPNDVIVGMVAKSDGTQCAYWKADTEKVTKTVLSNMGTL